jgi:hypothetical protein
MQILTDYRLIVAKDIKDRPDLLSEGADPSGTALAKTSSNSKLQTHPRHRERYKIENRNCLKENLKEKENWSRVPDGRLTPRLIVGCNVTDFDFKFFRNPCAGGLEYLHRSPCEL